MSDDSLFVGLDLNGAEDVCAYFRGNPGTGMSSLRGCCPPTIILPRQRGERPLAGVAAAEAIEGRGWPWPDTARATSMSDSLRVPVIELLARVEGQDAATWQGPGGAPSAPIGDLLGAHVQECLPSGVRRCVVLVPDSLSELGQQRLLDGLRKVVSEPELLWRPIGVLLGWAEREEGESLCNLHGTDAVIVHLGFAGLEVSRLGLEVEDSSVGPLLVPVRRGRGQRHLSGVGLRIVQHVAAQESRLLSDGEALQWQLQWASTRPWNLVLGRPPRDELLQGEDGNWLFASGPVGVPPAFDEIARDIAKELEGTLDEILAGGESIGCTLVEGPLCGCPLGETTLGDAVCDLVGTRTAKQLGGPAQAPRLASVEAAKGGALYLWRVQSDLPSYYDVLPQLEINAIRELRAEFIPLVPRAGKVRGGRVYGPKSVPGFSIGAGTSKLEYYLAKEDEPTVRLTETVVPEPPRDTTAVDLVVTQKPGQGFASVEIRPPVRGTLGGRTVYLDWSTMKDTGKAKDEILRELNEEYGFAYPDPVPVRTHASAWSDLALGWKIEQFLRQDRSQIEPYVDAAVSLRKSLGQRVRVGEDKCGPIGSDGKLPDHINAAALRLRNHRSVEDLFADLMGRIERDFAVLQEERYLDGLDVSLHRQLLLIAGWCYTAAPLCVMDYLRAVLSGRGTLNKQYAVNAIGRSFSDEPDQRLFFAWCADSFSHGIEAPLGRMKALVEILQYRENAPRALKGDQAYKFAHVARDVMKQEVQARRIKARFFKAAWLLVALLRFRLVDPTFLDPRNETHRALVGTVQRTLGQARDLLPSGPQRDTLSEILRQIQLYLERRGTDALLFSKLEAQAEGEDD